MAKYITTKEILALPPSYRPTGSYQNFCAQAASVHHFFADCPKRASPHWRISLLLLSPMAPGSWIENGQGSCLVSGRMKSLPPTLERILSRRV